MNNARYTIYKRDQVEQAVAISSGLFPQSEPRPFAALKIELKRLLDQDRRQERDTPPGRPVRRAFHDAPPPGRGFDVMYSSYEAFALLVALRLMRSGLTQARAVSFLIELRLPLAGAHYEILRLPTDYLRPDVDEAERRRLICDGYLVRDPEKMVYLTALAGDRAEVFELSSPPDKPVSGNICRSLTELHGRIASSSHERHALIVVELVNAALQLDCHLDRIQPRSRGRR